MNESLQMNFSLNVYFWLKNEAFGGDNLFIDYIVYGFYFRI